MAAATAEAKAQYSAIVLGATGNVGGRIVQLLIRNPRCKKAPQDGRRQRASRAENPPAQSAHARLQAPSSHGKIATSLLQETARPGKRRLSWLIRSRNALLSTSRGRACGELRIDGVQGFDPAFLFARTP